MKASDVFDRDGGDDKMMRLWWELEVMCCGDSLFCDCLCSETCEICGDTMEHDGGRFSCTNYICERTSRLIGRFVNAPEEEKQRVLRSFQIGLHRGRNAIPSGKEKLELYVKAAEMIEAIDLSFFIKNTTTRLRKLINNRRLK